MRCKSRSLRLSGQNAFKSVFAGRKVVTPDLVFYYAPNNLDLGRVGLVVGRKAYPGAVTRNLLKRRLRELFRKIAGSQARGYSVVIVARRGRQMPDFKTLERQMEKLAGVLGNK